VGAHLGGELHVAALPPPFTEDLNPPVGKPSGFERGTGFPHQAVVAQHLGELKDHCIAPTQPHEPCDLAMQALRCQTRVIAQAEDRHQPQRLYAAEILSDVAKAELLDIVAQPFDFEEPGDTTDALRTKEVAKSRLEPPQRLRPRRYVYRPRTELTACEDAPERRCC